VGTYRHAAWADLTVTLVGDTLCARYGRQFEGPLQHVQNDTFRARRKNPARGSDYLNFTIDVTRNVARVDLYLWLTATCDRVPGQRREAPASGKSLTTPLSGCPSLFVGGLLTLAATGFPTFGSLRR
jgi:hypothetical protein